MVPLLAKVEEHFLGNLVYGDTFLLRRARGSVFEGIRENECIVSDASNKEPKIPSYAGGSLPMSTYLAERVRGILFVPDAWHALPEQVQEWLVYQQKFSPNSQKIRYCLKRFHAPEKHYLVAFPFEGRIAHQSLASC